MFISKKNFLLLACVLTTGVLTVQGMEQTNGSFWSLTNIMRSSPTVSTAVHSASHVGDTLTETPWLSVALNTFFQRMFRGHTKGHHHHHGNNHEKQNEHGFFAAHLADIMSALIKVARDEFKPDGNGTEALKTLLASSATALQELVKDGGVGIKVLQEALKRLQAELQHGELKKATDVFFAMLSEQLKEDGEIKKSIEHLWNVFEAQGLKGLENLGEVMRGQMLHSGKTFEQMVKSFSFTTSRTVAADSAYFMHTLNGTMQHEINALGAATRKSFVEHGNAAIVEVGAEVQNQVGNMLEEGIVVRLRVLNYHFLTSSAS